MSALRRVRKQHLVNFRFEFSNLFPSFKTWWCIFKAVFGVRSPHPSIPSLQMAPRPISLGGMPQFCFFFHILCPQPLALCTHQPRLTQLLLDSVQIAPEKVEKFLASHDSDFATRPDCISLRDLNTSSATHAHLLSPLFIVSFALSHLPSALKSANINASHKQGRKTDLLSCRPISLLLNHQQSHGIHHRSKHQILPILQ